VSGGEPRGKFHVELLAELSATDAETLDLLNEDVLRRMEILDAEVSRWAAKVNLIGFGTRAERIRRYFAEPLGALPFVPRGGEALDIGSGGGSPALPLALVTPAVRWTLMESRRRKSLFLSEVARTVGLENVRVISERFRGGEREPIDEIDVITVRGVRMSTGLLEAIRETVRRGGRLLWFTGRESFAAVREELESRWDGEVSGPHRLLPGSVATVVVAERG
jgi:16S rRNA (guanine527-N7)-methyltransferase